MQRPPDSVADERPHHAEAVGLHVPLDRVRHVGQPAIGPALLDGQLQAFPGDVEELLDRRGNRPDGQGDRAIRVVAFHDTPEVEADDVAVLAGGGGPTGMPWTTSSLMETHTVAGNPR